MTTDKSKSDKTGVHEPSQNDSQAQRKLDPREELGLKSPVPKPEDSHTSKSELTEKGQKATEFDGDPAPQGAPSSAFKPKDDTPMKLGKSEGPRDDQ